MYSTANQPTIKKRVFGYTSPLGGKADRRRRGNHNVQREVDFITQTASRFSRMDPIDYLQQSKPGVIAHHIIREIELEKDRTKKIELSDPYVLYTELCIQREVLANELYRLERINNQIVVESNKTANRLAKMVTEVESPKLALITRDAGQYQENYQRGKELLATQRAALKARKQRELLSEINDATADFTVEETKRMREKINYLRQRSVERRRKNDSQIAQMNTERIDIHDKLVSFYNDNDQDILIPMADIIKYVRNEDPIILWKKFEDQKRKEKEQELWDTLGIAVEFD